MVYEESLVYRPDRKPMENKKENVKEIYKKYKFYNNWVEP
jgi:hypothetical protein